MTLNAFSVDQKQNEAYIRTFLIFFIITPKAVVSLVMQRRNKIHLGFRDNMNLYFPAYYDTRQSLIKTRGNWQEYSTYIIASL